LVLYTSSEDHEGHYKSYIEDVVYAAECQGAVVLPAFKYLRAHNNKVFAELLKSEWGHSIGDKLNSLTFGSLEEIIQWDGRIDYPVVIKRPDGFKSRGVFLAEGKEQMLKISASVSRSNRKIKSAIKDLIRKIKYKGFKAESDFRKKFVVQDFIAGLGSDFKILVYWNKYYVLKRLTRENDFRASGSGRLSYPTELPEGLLDFAEKAFKCFNVPNASFDISFNGREFNILEVQFLYFGTYTLEHSEFWFEKSREDKWLKVGGRSVLEAEYVKSITHYLAGRNNL
jgi:glutathione synthase/RimK-type ligase-like ATP-grasp enzyme